MILLVVRDGRLDVNWVLGLSIPQLNSLVLGVTRLKYRDKEEDAWTNLVASQMWKDPKKAMESHTKEWRKLTQRPEEAPADDFGRLITRFGSGT